MYTVKKTIEIAGAHKLNLDYDSKCNNLHGHNWIITVECQAAQLNPNGMVMDFQNIKDIVKKLDHRNLNDFMEQPTAENISKYLLERIPYCTKVIVKESEGNEASYEL